VACRAADRITIRDLALQHRKSGTLIAAFGRRRSKIGARSRTRPAGAAHKKDTAPAGGVHVIGDQELTN